MKISVSAVHDPISWGVAVHCESQADVFIICRFDPLDTMMKTNTWNVVKLNRDEQREDSEVKRSNGATLRHIKRYYTHTDTHTWNTHLKHTAAHALFMRYSEWMKRDAALSILEPFPCSPFFELRSEKKLKKKAPYAHFTSDDNVTPTPFSNSAATKSFDRRYFINAPAPSRSHNSERHMRDVPHFSQRTHVCAPVWHQYVSGGAFIMYAVEELWKGGGGGGLVESDSVRAEVSKREECC